MSSPIGTVGDLVLVIRAQLALRGKPAQVAPGTKAGKPRPAPTRYTDGKLASLIELRVGQIGRDDPGRGRKAFRVFLEAVLLSQFGDALVNDPKFYQMVDEVQKALEADPDCAKMVNSAIEQLLSKAPEAPAASGASKKKRTDT